jgi:hypothetical protein
MVTTVTAETKTLDEAFHLQQQTIETLDSIKEELLDTEEIGSLTLETLKREKYKINNIFEETDRLNAANIKTRQLHNRLGRWTMNFGGRARGHGIVSPKAVSPKQGETPLQRNTSPNREASQKKYWRTKLKKQKKNTENYEASILFGVSALKETHADELKELDENDKEIDDMLDETSILLGALGTLQNEIVTEIHTSREHMNVAEKQFDTAESKQHGNNARALDFLQGKWLRRANDTTN